MEPLPVERICWSYWTLKRPHGNGRAKIGHQGTYNANPLTAAAGVAALTIIAETDACERASRSAASLRSSLNAVIEEASVPWAAYGEFSMFHIFTNPKGRAIKAGEFDPLDHDFEELALKPKETIHKLRLALLINGVDVTGWPGGTVSVAHSEGGHVAYGRSVRPGSAPA